MSSSCSMSRRIGDVSWSSSVNLVARTTGLLYLNSSKTFASCFSTFASLSSLRSHISGVNPSKFSAAFRTILGMVALLLVTAHANHPIRNPPPIQQSGRDACFEVNMILLATSSTIRVRISIPLMTSPVAAVSNTYLVADPTFLKTSKICSR